MIRNFIIVIIVLVILGLALLNFFKPSSKNISISGTPASSPSSTKVIQDALTKIGSVTCDYKDSEGRSFKVYIKNGKIRSDITTNDGKAGTVLVKEKKIYYWSSQEAYMMELPDDSTGLGTTVSEGQQQQLLQSLQRYKQYCQEANVDDKEFVVPSNVTFKEYSGSTSQ